MPARDRPHELGEDPRSGVPASALLLAGLGVALVSAGVLLFAQAGPLVSIGTSVLTVLALCF
jgi:hypothetical protein